MCVYLIHFDRPYKHARHYIGGTVQFDERIAAHRNGSGARLLQVLKEKGIGWRVVGLWHGDYERESKIKKRKHGPRYCPICNPEYADDVGPDVVITEEQWERYIETGEHAWEQETEDA